MKQRLTSDSKEQADLHSDQVGRQDAQQSLEFDSAESLLRYDSAHIVVPPQVLERLVREIEGVAVSRPWWKRWFR